VNAGVNAYRTTGFIAEGIRLVLIILALESDGEVNLRQSVNPAREVAPVRESSPQME